MDTMFSLKGAQDQDPRLHFRRKNSQKSASWVFCIEVLKKKRKFRVFFIFDPLYLRTETEYSIHGFVKCTSVSKATF